MKILIFGAGVIGGIYAAKLHQTGHDVTLFARGNNYQRIKENGLSLVEQTTQKCFRCAIPVVNDPKDVTDIDLLIVTVRLEQLKSAFRVVQQINSAKHILFMLNNPEELSQIDSSFPNKKVFLGFPGVGGTKSGHEITYVQIKQQKTTLGTIEENQQSYLNRLKNMFRKAGFPTVLESKIKDWLIVHSVFISCVTASMVKEGISSERLGRNRQGVKEMVQCIKQGLRACQQQGIALVPNNIKTIFLTVPEWFSILYWQRALRGKTGNLGIEPHARAATDEMKALAHQVLNSIKKSNTDTRKITQLLTGFINS